MRINLIITVAVVLLILLVGGFVLNQRGTVTPSPANAQEGVTQTMRTIQVPDGFDIIQVDYRYHDNNYDISIYGETEEGGGYLLVYKNVQYGKHSSTPSVVFELDRRPASDILSP